MIPSKSELQRNHELALRAYEAQHAVWFNTVVHSDAGKRAAAKLAELREVYVAAKKAMFPGMIIV